MVKKPAFKQKTTYRRGLWAEFIAAWFLRLQGYRILATRYKTPVGEVDLIARKQNTLVFVEVKARKTAEAALEAVTPTMKRRIIRAAQTYIAYYPDYADYDMRFDVIGVSPPFSIQHLDNVWESTA